MKSQIGDLIFMQTKMVQRFQWGFSAQQYIKFHLTRRICVLCDFHLEKAKKMMKTSASLKA